MMVLLWLVIAATDPTAQPCLGVAVASQHGPVNLLGFSATGDKNAVDKLTKSAEKMGVRVGEPKKASKKQVTTYFFFSSPPMEAADAVALIQRARSGEFGPLQVETRTMGIETLPADKCSRN